MSGLLNIMDFVYYYTNGLLPKLDVHKIIGWNQCAMIITVAIPWQFMIDTSQHKAIIVLSLSTKFCILLLGVLRI